jgi:PAS domain S-box-containing protein
MPNDVSILLVEDSPTQAEKLRFLLQAHGFDVLVADNGRQALDVLEEHRPVLIVSDIVMPEMDGYQLCQLVKLDERLKDIPVMLLTRLSEPQDIIKGLECSADRFVIKPYEDKYLMARIQSILATQQLRERHKMQMGVQVFFAGEEHFITAERQQILDLLLSTYEAAIQKNAELERRAVELKALNAMAAIVNESLDVDEILNRAMDEVLRLVGVEAAAMLLLDELAGDLVMVAHRGIGDEFVQAFQRLKLDEGPGGQAAQTGQPVVLEHLEDYPAARKAYLEKDRIQSAVVVPLLGRVGVIGTMNLATAVPEHFDASGLELLVSLGRQIATGVEKARMYQETRAWAAELEERVEEQTAALAASEARYRTLFESVPVGIGLSTPEGRGLAANAAMCEMTGYSVEAFQQVSVADTYHQPADRAHLLERFQQDGFVRGLEAQLERRDGTVYWARLTVTPFTLAGERVFLTAAEDVTDRVQAKDALKQYSERLAEMVEERTKELHKAQAQLVQREKLAVLGQLAGGVSHELRNPLGAIKNSAYFLNMVLQDPEPDVAETLQILEKEVDTCNRIIGSLLDYAQPKLPALCPVDLVQLVQETLSRQSISEQVAVVTRFDESLPRARADPDQLRLVLDNIIRNAVQAMPQGGRLEIAAALLPSGDEVQVAFHDTGVGILPDQVARMFEPLFTTKAKGIGLGLALSKQLVEGMGGSIEVESEAGKGSTFAVRLPLSTARQEKM